MSVQIKVAYTIMALAFVSAILMLIVDPGWGRVLALAGIVCWIAGSASNLPQLEKTLPEIYQAARRRQLWQPKRIDRVLTLLGALLLMWGLWLSASHQ